MNFKQGQLVKLISTQYNVYFVGIVLNANRGLIHMKIIKDSGYNHFDDYCCFTIDELIYFKDTKGNIIEIIENNELIELLYG